MKKINHIFCLFMVLNLLIGCEQEEFNDEITNHETNIEPQLLSLKEAQKDMDFNSIIKDFELEKQIDNKFKSNDSLNINFDYFYKLENQNNKSFTFLIEKNSSNDSIIENLVVEKVNDTVRGYIIKYLNGHYKEVNDNLHLNANVVKTEYEGNIQELWNQNNLNNKSWSCGWVTTYTLRMCSNHGGFYSDNPACDNHGLSNWIPSSNYVCNHVPSVTETTDELIDLSVDTNGGGGGNGNGSVSPGTVPLIPCEDSLTLDPTLNEDCLNSGNNNVLLLDSIFTLDGPDIRIDSIESFLSIFDTSQDATIFFNVDQPIANQNEPNSGFNVGHSFITIKQGNKIRSFGFYPDGTSKPTAPTEPGIFGDNSLTEYDVNISKNVTGTKIQAIINLAKQYESGNYNLNDKNCTDFVIDVGAITDLDFGDASNNWYLGGGSNPGTLGQVLRSLISSGQATGITTGGTSPGNSE